MERNGKRLQLYSMGLEEEDSQAHDYIAVPLLFSELVPWSYSSAETPGKSGDMYFGGRRPLPEFGQLLSCATVTSLGMVFSAQLGSD